MAYDDISLEPLLNARTGILAGYQISDQEVGGTSYYGYLKKNDEWCIMKSVVAGTETNYTFTRGNGGYAGAWTGRAALTYGRFNDIF